MSTQLYEYIRADEKHPDHGDVVPVRVGYGNNKDDFKVLDTGYYRKHKHCFEVSNGQQFELKAIEWLSPVSPTTKIDWDALREKFFDECVDMMPKDRQPNVTMPKVNKAPHDLFEWFKKQLPEDNLAIDNNNEGASVASHTSGVGNSIEHFRKLILRIFDENKNAMIAGKEKDMDVDVIFNSTNPFDVAIETYDDMFEIIAKLNPESAPDNSIGQLKESDQSWKDKSAYQLSCELQDTLFIRPFNLPDIESKASRLVWKVQAETEQGDKLATKTPASSFSEDLETEQTKNINMKSGIELIAEERQEQITKHGRTVMHDVEFNDGEQLAIAAEMLLASEHEEGVDSESFPENWDKDICIQMLAKPYKEKLIKAGALIAAEIDRLQAQENKTITT